MPPTAPTRPRRTGAGANNEPPTGRRPAVQRSPGAAESERAQPSDAPGAAAPEPTKAAQQFDAKPKDAEKTRNGSP